MLTETVTVVAAAIRHEGKVYSIHKPARHKDVVHAMIRRGLNEPKAEDCGFKLSDGRFVTRESAKRYAYLANQIDRERFVDNHAFSSEDLW